MKFPTFEFSIDRGGTFTDIFGLYTSKFDGKTYYLTYKLLSEDPTYKDAAYEGICRILRAVSCWEFKNENFVNFFTASGAVNLAYIYSIKLSSTLATNALLEQKQDDVVLIVTRGFRDVLEIGQQSRTEIFDLSAAKPTYKISDIIEVDERVIPQNFLRKLDSNVQPIENNQDRNVFDEERYIRRSDEELMKSSISTHTQLDDTPKQSFSVIPIRRPHLQSIRDTLLSLVTHKKIRSVAIALLHSYAYPTHEEQIAEIAKMCGLPFTSISHRLSSSNRYYPRVSTAFLDASLTPLLRSYLQQFSSFFENENLERHTHVYKDEENIYTSPQDADDIHQHFTHHTHNPNNGKLLFMHSDGGLVEAKDANGVRAVLSGPSAGVMAFTKCTYTSLEKFLGGTQPPIIAFDMGGTSTDVSRYDGELSISSEGSIAGYSLYVPHLQIQSVAAGGGSQLFFKGGMFHVGPDSAKAYPGPACYRHNGPATVTDANVVLGRLPAKYLPQVFGPNKDQMMDIEASRKVIQDLTDEINEFHKKYGRKLLNLYEVAMGFIKVANESMTRPILSLTREKGFETSQHILCCYGGAGGLHACSMAKSLNIETVFIHKLAGILSAYGLNLADIQIDQSDALYYKFPSFSSLDNTQDWEHYEVALNEIKAKINSQKNEILERFKLKGFDKGISFSSILSIRYEGVDSHIQINLNECKNVPTMIQKFVELHHQQLGFTMPTAQLILEDSRTIGNTHSSNKLLSPLLLDPNYFIDCSPIEQAYEDDTYLDICFYLPDGISTIPTKVFDVRSIDTLKKLTNTAVEGPCLLCDRLTTILVEPDWKIYIEASGYILKYMGQNDLKSASHILTNEQNKTQQADPITLAVFGHRFMGIAEQMGKMLQRIAVSINIKQRLDFSCAIFGPTGNLVANAPHVPVHLGAMQEAVKWQLEIKKERWEEGDVVLCNHPAFGGSHLPDLTVITPLWTDSNGKKEICLFVASRGHHVDIGGIVPGSMPSFSTQLNEEGAAIKSFDIVKKGTFQLDACRALFGLRVNDEAIKLVEEGGNIPASPPCRRIDDVLSDLRAQVAANQKGVKLLETLIEEKGLINVLNYTQFLQDVSAESVKEMLVLASEKFILKKSDTSSLQIESFDYLDDGSLIHLNLNLDTIERNATFDFSKSSPEIYGNLNAPKAITKSAIIYCLRSLVKQDIPLNQGCMDPIEIILPQNSFLNPSKSAAVVAGNILTSQRITDVILSAFQACSNSHGCMNNLTFGLDNIAFIETIGGGCGAGPTWNGTSGVHCHMTNTRISDVESIERLYPVCLQAFGIRKASGGIGKYCGGNGLFREFEFLKDGINVNLLSERRSREPNGLQGGRNGKMGRNLWVRYPQNDSRFHILNLGGKSNLKLNRGDRIIILTPGGGGFGELS